MELSWSLKICSVFMLQVDPIQSYLNLKIGLPPVLKAGSSGIKRILINYKVSGFW
jgi:hypothetical protein